MSGIRPPISLQKEEFNMLLATQTNKGLLQTLIQKNLDGVIVFDLSRKLLVWNEAMVRLSGIDTSLALGKDLFDLCPFLKDIGEQSFISRCFAGEEALSKNRPFFFPFTETRGYFEAHYFPMTDELGQVSEVLCIFKDCTEASLYDDSLVNLTESLRKKLMARTEELIKANVQLKEEVKKRRRFGFEVLLKNIEMTDSISYAKEIQNAILPPINRIKESFGDLMLFFKPRDIVSGDFYWFHRKDHLAYLAAVDCTGHGVPGALLSMLGYNALNQAVNEQKLIHPNHILAYLDKEVTEVFKSAHVSVKDGMDVSILQYNILTRSIEFAGAINPLFIIRNGELIKIKGDRYPVGPGISENKNFTNHEINLLPGDGVYLFTDGYADQFGGQHGKKMKYELFRKLLTKCNELSMDEQFHLIESTFRFWQGDLEQVDDVLVLGFKVE